MKARVAYIVAAGHSGSTLLDLLLGSRPGVCSAGEFAYLPWQISRRERSGEGASRQKLCGCALAFDECPFWHAVINDLSGQVGFDVYAEPFRFRVSLMQNEKYFASRFSRERAQRFLFELAHRHGVLAPLRAWYHWRSREAVANSWRAYDAMARVAGCSHVVDSSKSVLRLRLLHEGRPDGLHAIVLFRDIRGVSWSAHKLGGDALAAARGWVNEYNRFLRVLRHMPDLPLAFARYEDLVADPVGFRRAAATFLGLPDPGPTVDMNTDRCHTVAGNGIRNRGRLEIRADTGWQAAMPEATQRAVLDCRQRLDPGWEELTARTGWLGSRP